VFVEARLDEGHGVGCRMVVGPVAEGVGFVRGGREGGFAGGGGG